MPIINKLPTIGNSGGSVDTGNKINVYCQEVEPYKKDGVWIQTDQISESLLIKDNWSDGSWSMGANIPYDYSTSSVAIIGNNIFLFGTASNAAHRIYAYKYDTTLNSYTRLPDIPYQFQSGGLIAKDEFVYLLGGGVTTNQQRDCYKYDTINNYYTKLPVQLPSDMIYSRLHGVAINNDMYIFGSANGSNYKFNTINNVFTKLPLLPAPLADSSLYMSHLISDAIYLVGNKAVLKYNIDDNTYTHIRTLPNDYTISTHQASDGDNIFIFNTDIVFAYNTTHDKYVRLTDSPTVFSNSGCRSSIYSSLNNKIYSFSYYNTAETTGLRKYNRIYSLPTKILFGNTVVVTMPSDNTGTYQTQFYQPPTQNFTDTGFGKFKSSFNDVSLGLGDKIDTTLPTYYGDGEQWVKFKN